MANNRGAEVLTFPTNVADFDDDERISFSRLDNKYIAVQDDGTEFEFDEALKRWIPLSDDDVNAGADAAAFVASFPTASDAAPDQSRKRKPDHSYYNNEVSRIITHVPLDAAFHPSTAIYPPQSSFFLPPSTSVPFMCLEFKYTVRVIHHMPCGGERSTKGQGCTVHPSCRNEA